MPTEPPAGARAITDAKPLSNDTVLPRLSRVQFWSFFALLLTIFLFSTGPVWRHPWKIATLDMAIFASYAPIPFLVAGGLAFKKRLTWKAFFLDTLELTLLKYSVTFGLALVFWGLTPPPPPAPLHVPRPPPLPADSAPPPTLIAKGQTGTLRGTVTTPAGDKARGALVYVAKGLEGFVFSPPETPLHLVHDGTGILPRLGAAQRGQPIFVRAGDGHLHTFVAQSEGRTMINIPLLRSGETTKVSFAEAHGVMSVRCSVHQRAVTEQASTLAVLAHPFFTFTGEEGEFRLDLVPAGELELRSVDVERASASSAVRLVPGGDVETALALRRGE
jgi:hypothetical protein